jgi:hypothetical protein
MLKAILNEILLDRMIRLNPSQLKLQVHLNLRLKSLEFPSCRL